MTQKTTVLGVPALVYNANLDEMDGHVFTTFSLACFVFYLLASPVIDSFATLSNNESVAVSVTKLLFCTDLKILLHA